MGCCFSGKDSPIKRSALLQLRITSKIAIPIIALHFAKRAKTGANEATSNFQAIGGEKWNNAANRDTSASKLLARNTSDISSRHNVANQ